MLCACLIAHAGVAHCGPNDHSHVAEEASLQAALATQAGDFERCKALLAPVREEIERIADPSQSPIQRLARCHLGGARHKLSPAEILALVSPWLERSDATEFRQRLPRAHAGFIVMRWRLLSELGFPDASSAQIREDLRLLLDREKRVDSQANARADLEGIAWFEYGNHHFIAEARVLLEMAEQALPDGDRIVILTLRALSFSERKLGHAEQSLAMVERAAKLVAHHQPGDRKLAVAIASDRAGALAAVSRYAEAEEEMLVWRAFVLESVPPNLADLVRVNYNLAALAQAMGDWQAAIGYADLSIASANAMPDTALGRQMRSELPVAYMTKQMSRLRLGEPGAVAELLAVLDRMAIGEVLATGDAIALAEHVARVNDTRNQASRYQKELLRRA